MCRRLGPRPPILTRKVDLYHQRRGKHEVAFAFRIKALSRFDIPLPRRYASLASLLRILAFSPLLL